MSVAPAARRGTAPPPSAPVVPAVEVAVVVGTVLLAIWVVPWLVRDRTMLRWTTVVGVTLAAAVVVASHVHRGEGTRALGLRVDNLPAALSAVMPFTLAGVAVLLAIGWLAGGLAPDLQDLLRQLRRLPLTVALQQYAFQVLVNQRLQRLLGPGRRSAVIAAVLFAVLHLPNPTLTIATLAGGYAWARAYQREPNLLATWLSHLVLSLALVAALPPALLPDLRVGWSRLRGH